jgi:hypothetical protein
MVQLVELVKLATPVIQATWVQLVIQAQPDQQVKSALMGPPDPPDQLAQPATKAQLEIPAQLETQAQLVTQVPQAPWVKPETLVIQVKPAPPAQPVKPDILVL